VNNTSILSGLVSIKAKKKIIKSFKSFFLMEKSSVFIPESITMELETGMTSFSSAKSFQKRT
jgi:hypothetical protein